MAEKPQDFGMQCANCDGGFDEMPHNPPCPLAEAGPMSEPDERLHQQAEALAREILGALQRDAMALDITAMHWPDALEDITPHILTFLQRVQAETREEDAQLVERHRSMVDAPYTAQEHLKALAKALRARKDRP